MGKAYYAGLDLAKNIFLIFTAEGKDREIGNGKMSEKTHARAALAIETRKAARTTSS